MWLLESPAEREARWLRKEEAKLERIRQRTEARLIRVEEITGKGTGKKWEHKTYG